MGGELFVLAIVLASLATGIVMRYLGLKEKRARTDPAAQARVDALEARIATLERIVTDKGYDLKREFDKL